MRNGFAPSVHRCYDSFGEKVMWPTDLATLEHDAMIIRESTHRFSPFSIDVGMIGRNAIS